MAQKYNLEVIIASGGDDRFPFEHLASSRTVTAEDGGSVSSRCSGLAQDLHEVLGGDHRWIGGVQLPDGRRNSSDHAGPSSKGTCAKVNRPRKDPRQGVGNG